MGARARRAAAAGMVAGRVLGFDDGEKMALERQGKGAVVRLLFPQLDANDWNILKTTLASGPFWCVIDKSGLVVEMQKKVIKGVVFGSRGDDIIDSLPLGAQLPEGIRWSDFTRRQQRALALITDLDKDYSLEQVAMRCEATPEELRKWEGNDKFLRVKRWLLERQKHLVRERALKNVIQGMNDPDNAASRDKNTGYALEIVQLIGKTAKVPQPGKDPQLEAAVKDMLDSKTTDERKRLAEELSLMSKLLSDQAAVMVDEKGNLAARETE